MQLTAILTTLLAVASTSLGNPVAEPAVDSQMVAGSTWVVQSFKRVCNAADTSCTYTYSINSNDGSGVPKCNYKTTGATASRKSYSNIKCGAYTVGSTWSGQFGPNQGFQTLSVVKGKQIIYPSYTDAELKAGKVVSPDKSYTPQQLS